jgi:hypothetical protein
MMTAGGVGFPSDAAGGGGPVGGRFTNKHTRAGFGTSSPDGSFLDVGSTL